MIKLVPPIAWAVAAIVLVLALAFGYNRWAEGLRDEGRAEVQAEWDASVERGKREIAELKAKAEKVTVRTEIKYVDRVKTIREKGDVIVKEVTKFVPVDSGYLSGGFRVFHDAAVENRVPDPSKISDAAPTAVTDVATTVAENYEKCHVAYARVEAWQSWAKEQCSLNENGCVE